MASLALRCSRKLNLKCRWLIQLALQRDDPAKALCDLVRYGEPQSGAGVFGGEKWIENPVLLVWSDAWTGVLNSDYHYLTALRDVGDFLLRGALQKAATFHSLNSILNQIVNDLLDSNRISNNGGKVFFQGLFKLYSLIPHL